MSTGKWLRLSKGYWLMDNGSFRCFAVFGNPVLHSRSPQLYNSLFHHDRIDACYTRIHATTGKAVSEIIRMTGMAGANITTPFKEAVLPFLDRLSSDAEKISAVNTIINRNGELTGYNTDAGGITGSLREAGIDPAGKKCMVMGAGGAGKAAVTGLLKAGGDVMITNRTPDKAFKFASEAGCWFAAMDEAASKLKLYDILVLALPPGIYPFGPEHVHPGLVIVDANYRSSSEDKSLDRLKCRVITGNRWLLHQAVGAYRSFTGKEAVISLMDRALEETPDPADIEIKIISEWQNESLTDCKQTDMFVDGRGLSDMELKEIIDEEKNKAFKGKG